MRTRRRCCQTARCWWQAATFAVLASAELYNPVTVTWTLTGSLNNARADHTATLLSNGMVLVAGGPIAPRVALASSELYNSLNESWTATNSLNTARYQHTATLLQNGQVLAAGGASSGGVNSLASAELYPPSTPTQSPTPSPTATATATFTPTPTPTVRRLRQRLHLRYTYGNRDVHADLNG